MSTENPVTNVRTGRHDPLETQLVAKKVHNICSGLLKIWAGIIAVDCLMATLMAPFATWPVALSWLALNQALLASRRQLASRLLINPPSDPARAMTSLVRWSGVIGLSRSIPLWLSAWLGSELDLQRMSMVILGLAAGAITTSGNEVRVFRAWAWFALGALVVCWSAQGTWITAWIALSIVFMGRSMADHTREFGAQERRLMLTTRERELERDKVADANRQLGAISEQLREERDRAHQASETKTRVLASVSHDLRQPLFGLSLNTAALTDVAQRLDDPVLQRIEQGLRRGLVQSRSLLDQLVDFARLDAGTIQVRSVPVDVKQFAQGMAVVYENLAAERGLVWRLALPDSPLWVSTDAALFERLLGNLLHNAIKFTDPGGSVELRVSGAVNVAVIDVVDTGSGIPADELERVFEEFYQLDNPSRDRAKGVGLGLSIVRRLGMLLDADVALASRVGHGTRFTVRLHRIDSPAAVGVEGDRLVPPPAEAIRSMAPILLAIDDEPDLLEGLSIMLSGKGWRVLTASDADEACRVVADGARPDALLADYRLANGRTGVDAVRAVGVALGAAVPAVIVTGDTAPDRIAEANAAGFPVLHKPLEGDAVAEALRALLRERSHPAMIRSVGGAEGGLQGDAI